MKTAAIALATTLLAALSGTALADSQLAIDATVTSVVTDAGTRTRAIAGDDNGGYLVIERLSSRGGASDQIEISELPLGRGRVPMSELKNLRLISLSQNVLQFEANPRTKGGNRMTISCTANLELGRGKVSVAKASCTSGGQPYAPQYADNNQQPPPPPAPASISTQQLNAISKTCDDAFSFDSEQKKCLDMSVEAFKSGTFPQSTQRVINACATAFAFGSTRFSCMQTAFISVREPAELISWCAGKNDFESERQSCLAKYGSTR